MNRISLLFLISFIFTSTSWGQEKEARLMVEELCSEHFFGRGYVKGGDSLAAIYLASEFEKRGLAKIGNSYFQSFHFDVNTFPGKMEVTRNGEALQAGVDFMIDPNSGSANLKLVPRYISMSELLQANFQELFVRELRGDHAWNSILIDTEKSSGDSLKYAKEFAFALQELMPVIVLVQEKFTFSVSQTQVKFPLVYAKPYALKNGDLITLNIEAKLIKQHEAKNVIAFLPARKKTKKTLFFTAHYDHLGGMGDHTYFPGGNDNASGTAMLFSLADFFKQKRPKYNLVFIAFAGEEVGLLGSKHYVENPLLPLKKIQFLLNLDIMGSGEEGITVVNGSIHPKEFKQLEKINESAHLLKQIKSRGKAANSDHYWFSEKGVPAFFIYTMGENKNYHDVFDRYEALSFTEYTDIIELITAFVAKL